MSTASFSPATSVEVTRKPCGDAVNTSVVSFVSERAVEAATASKKKASAGESSLVMERSFRGVQAEPDVSPCPDACQAPPVTRGAKQMSRPAKQRRTIASYQGSRHPKRAPAQP